MSFTILLLLLLLLPQLMLLFFLLLLLLQLLLAAVFAICRFAVGLEVGVGDGVEVAVAVAVAVGFLRWPCNWMREERGRAGGGARHLKVQRVCRRTASTVGASRECGTRREWGRGGAAE